jgi:hypothetical protein
VRQVHLVLQEHPVSQELVDNQVHREQAVLQVLVFQERLVQLVSQVLLVLKVFQVRPVSLVQAERVVLLVLAVSQDSQARPEQ